MSNLLATVPEWMSTSFPIIQRILLILIAVLALVLIILVFMQITGGSNTSNVITGNQDSYYSQNKSGSREGRITRLIYICTTTWAACPTTWISKRSSSPCACCSRTRSDSWAGSWACPSIWSPASPSPAPAWPSVSSARSPRRKPICSGMPTSSSGMRSPRPARTRT